MVVFNKKWKINIWVFRQAGKGTDLINRTRTGSTPVGPTIEKNAMSNFKKICDLSWCKMHNKCIFHNVESSLKADAYKVALGSKVNADIIICYQKEDIGLSNGSKVPAKEIVEGEREILEPKPKCNQIHCESPHCSSVADIRFNDKVNLCYSCLDLLRRWKTNRELAVHFGQRHRLIKLLKTLNELENPNKKEKVIRCANIYCGTTEAITRHHLYPKRYRQGLVGKCQTIPLCESCHKRVHWLKSNGTLATQYNTKGAIINLLASDVPFRTMRVLKVYDEMELMAVA